MIDTHQLLLALEADVTNAGGTIAFNTEVTRLAHDAAGAFLIETRAADGGVSSVTAGKLVIAAGLEATQLGGLFIFHAPTHDPLGASSTTVKKTIWLFKSPCGSRRSTSW